MFSPVSLLYMGPKPWIHSYTTLKTDTRITVMDEIGLQLFEEALTRNQNDIDKALSETIQSISLLGLSRTDFFSKAAFYGGTALRILFRLDRFSEDLDFTAVDRNFELTSEMLFEICKIATDLSGALFDVAEVT